MPVTITRGSLKSTGSLMADDNATAIAAGTAGIILLYSAVSGKGILATVKNVIQGKTPAPVVNQVQGAGSQPITSGGTTSASGTAVVTAPNNASEAAFFTAVLAAIGAPPTAANLHSMDAWRTHETPWPPVAANNPLNTTQQMTGATDYNSVGVKNYPSALEGVTATAATLLNGNYGDVVAALRSGRGLCGQSFAGLSTWSGGGYSEVC